MQVFYPKSIVSVCMLLFAFYCSAQNDDNKETKVYLNSKIVSKLSNKISKTGDAIDVNVSKYLNRIRNEEKLLQNKLAKVDSLKAAKLFGDIDAKYQALIDFLNTSLKNPLPKAYLGHLDTLLTGLQFFQKQGQLNLPAGVLDNSISQLNQLQLKLSNVEEVKSFLLRREGYLIEQFAKLGRLGDLKGLTKHIYYFQAQIGEIKNTFADPSRLEEKFLSNLATSQKFKNFFEEYSMSSNIFRSAPSLHQTRSLIGLQTRASVQELTVTLINNKNQFLQSQLSESNKKLTDQKNDVNLHSLPNHRKELSFKPNTQKAKSFLQRLEKGANIHFGKAGNYLPVNADIGLSVGYKLNDKSVVGIGTSYKLGLGKSIINTRFSSQGYTFRSYLEWKLKGSLFIYGGYEKILLTAPEINTLGVNPLQDSKLLGISKKVAFGNRLKGSLQLLYDFAGTTTIPRREPIIFRIGYNF